VKFAADITPYSLTPPVARVPNKDVLAKAWPRCVNQQGGWIAVTAVPAPERLYRLQHPRAATRVADGRYFTGK